MYNLREGLRVSGILLTPFIPGSAGKVLDQIGACQECRTWDSAAVYGSLRRDVTVQRGENLFPRVDTEKALAQLEAAAASAPQCAPPGREK